ncbi:MULTISPECIES: hypothetical protein [unclassified Sphingomonas]|uniref:hypothetical protein n=1 Tax=unclassified Sphingomonas TaxID=196159 RepID=UPI002151EA8C|nr:MULTISPECIES: hypothetical protein [unclassified Sphingomonas]MCR5869768.1 hypothetical protein [Sphingomonas sp. J344]UUX98528.1 hypothetical protein LRS08_13320 [Sphingomonas sp. J315]
MTEDQQSIARDCLSGAEANRLSFPEIVGALIDAGFDSYLVDYRRNTATYYRPDGTAFDLPTHIGTRPVAAAFDASAVRAAIAEAQANAPGYTYLGFGEKVRAAGCAGYLVSFPGRRVLYFGRDGDTHVEHFPS